MNKQQSIPIIETDVLIVGSGPAGGAAALLLATYGIKALMVTRFNWLAHTPRAHITNQRTLEVLRDVGVEQEALDIGTPQDLMGHNVICESLTGEELGRLHSWGTSPERKADYKNASPCPMLDIPQTLMEPILVSNAAKRGTKTRFNSEFISMTQDENGVTSKLKDRVTGQQFEVRSKYLLGADGSNSVIAKQLALPFEGEMGLAGSINILFDADMTKYVAHRPSVLYWVLQPGSDVGGVGMGVVRMVRPWNQWLAIWGYDINEGPPDLPDDEAIRIVRNLVGDQELDVKIKSISTWTVNHMYATKLSEGRVFCMGDAIHRHPPTNGLGSNTSIQDAYNICWKIAMVLRGNANEKLLESYDKERAPIAKQIVERANKSVADYGRIFESLGLMSTKDPAQMISNIAERKNNTAAGAAKRKALREAIHNKNYEFNAHGVELNHRYVSDAVATDGTDEPAYHKDKELFYHPTTFPGARLPHCWLYNDGKEVSTLDLAGKGRFTLFTGLGGEQWSVAAEILASNLNIDIFSVVVGPGQDVEDLFGEWARLSEIDDDGVLLVRPDGHVCFRAFTKCADPHHTLHEALSTVLGLS
ncbi:FAD-dependent oxidoreductase [Alteromonas sp. P256]|uniref:FAD-dependent oxidoreductase n=1 Tax=Alteromonas sp. P256 TaxID=3117399 RepID=UPI002FE2F89A